MAQYGIELDGTVATVVEVNDGAATAVNTFAGATPSDALAAAMSSVKTGRGKKGLRISLPAPGLTLRRVDVTREALRSRSAFEDVVYSALPVSRTDTTAAAFFYDPSSLVASALGAAAAVVAPRQPIEQAYRVVNRVDAEVVAPPLTLVGTDGLHLAIRRSTADLTLVVNGRPVAARQLRAGGTGQAASAIGENGEQVVEVLLKSAPGSNPLAEAEITRYFRAVAAEVKQTAESWARSGEMVPATIHIFGHGGRSRELDDHLSDQGFERVSIDEMVRAMAFIPLGARETAVGAFLAAVTIGVGAPQAAFPNPLAAQAALAGARRKKSQKTLAIIAAAIIVPVLAYFGPTLNGQRVLNDAQSELTAAQSQLAAKSATKQKMDRYNALKSKYVDLATSDPRWAGMIAQIYDSAPSGTTISSISLTRQSEEGAAATVLVTLQATSKGKSVRPATSWITDIKSQFDAPDASTSGVTIGEGSTSYSLTFNIKVDKFAEDRPLEKELKK